MMATLPTLGFAGIGLMGLPMCRRLLAAGYPLVVWNRNREKCAPLLEAGARLAETPARLCEAADLVLLCLANTEVVREVVFGAEGIAQGARAGQLLVDLSSLEPTATREWPRSWRARPAWAGSMPRCPAARPVPRLAAWRSWSVARRRISKGYARSCSTWGNG
ncbi:hypothetical protein JM49_23680 [Pseudomonas chlororaphis subsp. aurantiaca]|nr:hypothetical protein JM49_23680 [Pseudomonas chlororaphis subsp. aurantiaca]